MATVREETELGGLRQQARQWAQVRGETVGSGHLMAVIAAGSGTSGALFRDRRVDPEDLLRFARRVTDEMAEPLKWSENAAALVARRMRAHEVSATHLVVALLSERRTAAFQVLKQLGIDVSRLRLAAMNQAAGQLAREPVTARPAEAKSIAARVFNRPQAVAENRSASAHRPSRAQLVSPEEFRDVRDRSRKKAAAARLTPQDPGPDSSPGGDSVTAEDAGSLVGEVSTGIAEIVEKSGPTQVTSAARPVPIFKAKSSVKKSTTEDARTANSRMKRFDLSKKKFPLLRELGRNLTEAAAKGELDPVVCREAEVDQVLDVLAKRLGNNPCVVGPSGVGKTKVIHAVAQRIANAQQEVDQYILVEIGAGTLVAGTGVRGGLAARMQQLCKEAAAAPMPLVVFFDEIHQLFTGDGGEELTAEFKRVVSRGLLPCIGATTQEEYTRHIEKDAALHRRFSLVEIDEPSRENAYLIVESLADKFETHHHVSYRREALALSITWSVKYLSGRALPDKAVSIVDLSGARARRRGFTEVTAEQVAEVVADLTDVPVERLLQTDAERMLRLESSLAERVVGHEACLASIARSIRRNAVGLGARRPIGTFLLLGPTGVGKTETAKALAETLFFSEHAMTRIDMSEYSEPHSVARLIGAPPGYVGHEAGGQLTEAVRRRPYQVLLLDELEKAHEDVLASFLGVFDEGRMTDGRGRTIDFTNTVIVMTSNLGARDLATTRSVGFQRDGAKGPLVDYRERIMPKVREALAPELYNRLDDILVFEPLGREQVAQIAERLLASLSRRMSEGRELIIDVAQSAMDCLIAKGGSDLSLGARPMQRTIARMVESPLAELILRGEAVAGDRIVVRARRGDICLEVEREMTSAPGAVSAAE